MTWEFVQNMPPTISRAYVQSGETFRIQILSNNVSNDESESLYETVWLEDQIPIHKKIFFSKKSYK